MQPQVPGGMHVRSPLNSNLHMTTSLLSFIQHKTLLRHMMGFMQQRSVLFGVHTLPVQICRKSARKRPIRKKSVPRTCNRAWYCIVAYVTGPSVQPCWILTSDGTAAATAEHSAQNVLGATAPGNSASGHRSCGVQKSSAAIGSNQEGSLEQ